VTAELERLTRVVYTKGRDVALAQGIIIADTKFEFGRTKEGEIILIDEVMTPDSSRFWPADGYRPGKPQPSFDKHRCATGSMSSAMPAAGTAKRRRPAAARGRRRHQQALSRSLSPADRRHSQVLGGSVMRLSRRRFSR
jgi:phosphoribosylaminoimidazole-succinocarboxamide synthase